MIARSKSRLWGLAALAVSVLVAPAAQAQQWSFNHIGPDPTGVEVALALILVTDVGFGTYDVATAIKGNPPAKGAAIAEMAFAVPQVVLLTVAILYALPSSSALGLGALTLLPVALTIHGIHALASASGPSEPIRSREVGAPATGSATLDRLQLRPTLLLAQRGAAPGLSLGFQF